MKFTHLYGHGTRLQPSRLATGWQIPAGSTGAEDVSDADWRPAFDGIDRADLTTSASITRWRLRAGARLPEHDHEHLEYVLVRSGRWQLVERPHPGSG